jgi:hypothetical protein
MLDKMELEDPLIVKNKVHGLSSMGKGRSSDLYGNIEATQVGITVVSNEEIRRKKDRSERQQKILDELNGRNGKFKEAAVEHSDSFTLQAAAEKSPSYLGSVFVFCFCFLSVCVKAESSWTGSQISVQYLITPPPPPSCLFIYIYKYPLV